MSSSVFSIPRLILSDRCASSFSSPMANRTCEASNLVDEHAEPVDAAIPLNPGEVSMILLL